VRLTVVASLAKLAPTAVALLVALALLGVAPGAGDLVDVRRAVPGVVVYLPYATRDNITGRAVYPSHTALLRSGTAAKLARAQADLAAAGLGLKVWDAYRPLSVQWALWAAHPRPGFVAHPRAGSNHNRGAAVDVTLIDLQSGRELPMPTPFDEFTPRARRSDPLMKHEARRNLAVLEAAMKAAGFAPYAAEWWHYDDPDWPRYGLLDTPLPPSRTR
jgi:D-alanyl-D-alanine dipeptidase